jgi:predicted  nucleic acid-binding Zn-ribbon protein
MNSKDNNYICINCGQSFDDPLEIDLKGYCIDCDIQALKAEISANEMQSRMINTIFNNHFNI